MLRLLLIHLVCMAVAGGGESADLVLFNGKIISVDAQFRIHEAMAIRGERILAVGSNERILSLAGENTTQVDLQGAVVLPGLIDSHTHPLGAAMYEFDHPVPEMRSIRDVLSYIRARAQTQPPGTWIVVQQVFITRLRERRYPTKEELDGAAPNHPVAFRTGPDMVLNSLGLKLNEIDPDAPLPSDAPAQIDRDPETGKPTGLVRRARQVVRIGSAPGKRPTDEDRLARLRELFADYNSVGLTAVSDRNASDLAIRLYGQLLERGELTCRVYCHASLNASLDMDRIRRRLEGLARNPHRAYNTRLRVNAIKVFLDGGMLTGSAYMLRPWGVSRAYGITDPTYRGLLFIPPEKLRRLVREVSKRGLQFTAHAVGDGAVETLLSAYAAVGEELNIAALRPCVTHSNFLTPRAIELMRLVGAVADMQPAWLYLDGTMLREHFGEERLRYFQPLRTLFSADIVVGGGSDHMQKIGSFRSVNPYNPFLGMWITLTRRPRGSERPLHPEERLTREQAIRMYTINNAYLLFWEKDLGSLEPGKLADFIVIDRDPLTCPIDDIRTIKVLQTWLGGKQVYTAPGVRD